MFCFLTTKLLKISLFATSLAKFLTKKHFNVQIAVFHLPLQMGISKVLFYTANAQWTGPIGSEK